MSDRPRLGVATTEPPSGSPDSAVQGDGLASVRLSRVPTSATASSTSNGPRRDYTALDLALLSSPAKPSPTQPSIAGVPSADASFPLSLDSQAWAERQGFLIMQLTSGANAASLRQIMPPGLASPSFGPFAAGSRSHTGAGAGVLSSSSAAGAGEDKDAPVPSFDELEQEALEAALASFDLSLLESTHFMTSTAATTTTTTTDSAASSSSSSSPAPGSSASFVAPVHSSHAASSALAAGATSALAALRRDSLAPNAHPALPPADADVPEPDAGPDLKDEMRRNMAAIWLENERRRLKAAAGLKRSKTGAKTVLTIMSPFSPRAQASLISSPPLPPHDAYEKHGPVQGLGHGQALGQGQKDTNAGHAATAAAAAIDAAGAGACAGAGAGAEEPEAAVAGPA